MTDPHSVLGVPRVRTATRSRLLIKAGMKYHPDKNPDNPEIATEKFVGI
jgi:curved DNA-binding protein CbpA